MKNSKVSRIKKSNLIFSLIVLIVVALVSTTFAWFTDRAKVDVSNTVKFGDIKLSSSNSLDVDVKRSNVDYKSGGKLMPGDTLVVSANVKLDSTSQDAYYLAKISDTYGFLEESYYFADGTKDSNDDLVVYELVIGESGTSTVIQGTTTTSDKIVGKITKNDTHELKLSIKIPTDFEDENATTKFICDIGVIQQANLSEADAQAKLIEGVETRIPDDFAVVDYIQSTGTQYIDTNYTPTSNTKVEMEFCATDVTNNAALFCARTGMNSNTYSCFILPTTIRADFGSNQTSISSLIVSANQNYKLTFESGKVSLNDNEKTFSEETFTAGGPMVIFTSYGSYVNNNFSGFGNYAKMKLYDFKIYDNGTLVRHFVPVVRISDVEAGLFDTVEGKFYTNQGTGSFTTPSVAEGYTDVNYIQSTGTQYINTGVNIDASTQLFNIDLSIKWNDISTRQLMGYNGDTAGYFGVTTNGYYENAGVETTFLANTTSYDLVSFSQDSTNRILSVNGETDKRNKNAKSGELTLLMLIGGYQCKVNLSYCKVTVDDVLVRDFLPVVRNSDKVAGLYDTVNDVFYENQGTGAFSWG